MKGFCAVKKVLVGLVCLMILMAMSGSVYASQVDDTREGILSRIMQRAGIELNIVSLDRDDGFLQAIVFAAPDIAPVIISLNTQEQRTYLVESGGNEAIVKIREDGSMQMIDGQQVDLGQIFCNVIE